MSMQDVNAHRAMRIVTNACGLQVSDESMLSASGRKTADLPVMIVVKRDRLDFCFHVVLNDTRFS